MGEDELLENNLINLKITEANIEYLQGVVL